MKVYLAGKMDAEYGSWRDALLGRIYDYQDKRHVPRWELVRRGTLDGFDAPFSWPVGENRHVLGMHDYVGPYRMTYEHGFTGSCEGYFHGSTGPGQHGHMDDDERSLILRACSKALHRADFVFAYLNRPDCFGTLAEIGYARALGKYVHVVLSQDAIWDWGDYWFVTDLVNAVDYDDPQDRPEGEGIDARMQRLFEHALVIWTGRPEAASPAHPLALVQANDPNMRLFHEAAQSFSQISRWSADPRVRNEAARMLKRIAG